MPRFYGLTNNDAKEDWPKNYAEIHAITHYLFAKSTPPADFVDPPAKTDPAKGKELFLQKGCLACHQHRPYASRPRSSRPTARSANPDYKPRRRAARPTIPRISRASVQRLRHGGFRPEPVEHRGQVPVASRKASSGWPTGSSAPEKYHPKSLMPNLQLSSQDAADIASWIISVPGEWPVKVEVPGVDPRRSRTPSTSWSSSTCPRAAASRRPTARSSPCRSSEIDEFVARNCKLDEKLLYLGERTISRLGCFGCHTIPGFENAKPIGTALNDWGIKSPARLDYGHIREYLDRPARRRRRAPATAPIRFYQEKVTHETRMGFLFQKLHRPRSYDYLKKSEKYKPWDDRLRMPQFAWANDPAAIEEVMTLRARA